MRRELPARWLGQGPGSRGSIQVHFAFEGSAMRFSILASLHFSVLELLGFPPRILPGFCKRRLGGLHVSLNFFDECLGQIEFTPCVGCRAFSQALSAALSSDWRLLVHIFGC